MNCLNCGHPVVAVAGGYRHCLTYDPANPPLITTFCMVEKVGDVGRCDCRDPRAEVMP